MPNKNEGKWQNWDNVEKALRDNFGEMIDRGVFPSQKMLADKKLTPAIHSQGGAKKIASKLNCIISNHWKTRDNHLVMSFYELLLDEYLYSRQIPHEPNIKFSDNYRCDQKINDIYIELWGYSKSKKGKLPEEYNKKRIFKEGLYKQLNLNLISIESEDLDRPIKECENYFNKLFGELGFNIEKQFEYNLNTITKSCGYAWTKDIIIEKLKKMSNELGYFPTFKQIRKLKEHRLSDAIIQFGGIHQFCNELGYNHIENPKNYWTEEIILEKIKEVIKKLGTFPSRNELKKTDRFLLAAISRNNGIEHYRKHFGYKQIQKRNYWTEETITNELKKIIEDFQEFPSQTDLKHLGHADLTGAINNFKNFEYFRLKLGFSRRKNPKTTKKAKPTL